MSCFKVCPVIGPGLILLLILLVSGCRGDGDYGDYEGPGGGGGGGGGGGSATEACQHVCGCSGMSIIPDCQSVCLEGLNMISDKDGCIDCMLDASCDEYEGGDCNSLCGGY